MAEETLDLRGVPKPDAYRQLDGHIRAVLAGVRDDVAAMATMGALNHNGVGNLWTRVYRVVEQGELHRVVPYQGTLGCLEIRIGRGVCGTAAAERRTIVVPDVFDFPGHITCDARSRSEIVVPVLGRSGTLIGVLDIDSDQVATFDDEDQRGLERIVQWFTTESE
jgi:GAF domain-containing protein